jgi:hypothetical protein
MPTKKKPIYVSNPNDSRIRAYNDSLNTYNSYLDEDKFWSKEAIVKRKNENKYYSQFSQKNYYGQKANLKPIAYNNYQYSKGKFTENQQSIPVYKEPEQPYIYKKVEEKIKKEKKPIITTDRRKVQAYNDSSFIKKNFNTFPHSKSYDQALKRVGQNPSADYFPAPEQPYILKKEKKKIKKDIVPVPVKESIPKDTIPIIEPVVKPQVEKEPEPIVPKKLPGGSGPFARYPNMKGQLSNVKTSRMVNARKVKNIVPTFVSGAKSVKQYRGDENLPEAKNGMKKGCGCKHSKSKYKYAAGTKSLFVPFPQMQPYQQNEYRMGMQKDADFNVTNIGRYAKPTKAQKELSARMDAKYKAAVKSKKVHKQKTPDKATQVTLPPPAQVIPTAPIIPPVVPPVVVKPTEDSWTENQWQDFLKEKNNVPYIKPTPYIPVAKKQAVPKITVPKAKAKPVAPVVIPPKPKPINSKFLDSNSKGVLLSQQGPAPVPKVITPLEDVIYNFPKDKNRKVTQVPVNTEAEEPSIIDSVKETIDGLISGGKRLIQKTQKENPESINNQKIVDEDTVVTPPKSNVKIDSLPVNYGYKEFKTYPDPYSNNPTDSLVSFRNVFDNDSGAEYVIGHKINEVTKAGAKKRFNNVRGVAHFLRDSDILPGQKITPKKWTTTKGDQYETTSPGKTVSAPDLQYMDRYRMLYKPIAGTDKYKTKYIKTESQENLEKLKKEGWETDFTVSAQHKFSDIDWNKEGKKTGYKGAFDETRWVPLKNGEFTHIPYKDKGSFSRFSGGSVTYLFKHPVTGKSIGADFSGSVNDMRDYGNKLIEKYKIKPEELELVYHDMGSYSAKPKAKNGTLDYDQWEGYNSYNKGFSGAPLMIPKYKYGTGALTIPEGSAIVTANGGKNKQALRAYKKGNYKLLNKIIDGMPEDNVDKAQAGRQSLEARYKQLGELTGPLSEAEQKEFDDIKTQLTEDEYDIYDDKRIAEKFGQKYDVDKAKFRSSLKGGKLNLKENTTNANYRESLRDPKVLKAEIAAGKVKVDAKGNISYTAKGSSAEGNQEFLGTAKKGTLPPLKGLPPEKIPPPKTNTEEEYEDVDTETIKAERPVMSAAETSAIGSVLGQGVPRDPRESYLKLNKYNYASQLPKNLQENSLAEQSGRNAARDIVGGDAGRYLGQAGTLSASRMKANNEAVINDTLARQDIYNKNVDVSNVESTTNRNLKDYYDDIKRQNTNDYNALLVKGGQSFDESFDNYQRMKSENQLKAQELQLLKESSPNYTMVKDPKTGLMKSVYRYKKTNTTGTPTTGTGTNTGTGTETSAARGTKKLKTYKRK